jgi:hypothetical protein
MVYSLLCLSQAELPQFAVPRYPRHPPRLCDGSRLDNNHMLVGGDLTILKNMKVNRKDYPFILWKIKKVWNHQPDMMMLRGGVNHDELFLHIATSSTCHVIKLTGWWHDYIPPMIHDVGTLKKYCLFYSMIWAASMQSGKIYIQNCAAHARRAMLNAQQWHHGIQALICRDPSAKFGGCFG